MNNLPKICMCYHCPQGRRRVASAFAGTLAGAILAAVAVPISAPGPSIIAGKPLALHTEDFHKFPLLFPWLDTSL